MNDRRSASTLSETGKGETAHAVPRIAALIADVTDGLNLTVSEAQDVHDIAAGYTNRLPAPDILWYGAAALQEVLTSDQIMQLARQRAYRHNRHVSSKALRQAGALSQFFDPYTEKQRERIAAIINRYRLPIQHLIEGRDDLTFAVFSKEVEALEGCMNAEIQALLTDEQRARMTVLGLTATQQAELEALRNHWNNPAQRPTESDAEEVAKKRKALAAILTIDQVEIILIYDALIDYLALGKTAGERPQRRGRSAWAARQHYNANRLWRATNTFSHAFVARALFH